jgi:predicted glutamine amidotransferase
MLFLALDRGHSKSIDNQIPFFAEPGNIEIHTTLKNFFSDAKITGSETNDTYQEYLKTRALITDRQNQLLVEVFNADKEKDAAKLDSLSAINKKLTARQYLNAVNFALNHNSSDVAPYIALTELYDRNIKYLDAIYNSLTDKTATNKYGQQLKEYIEERKAEHITE